jgi:hypothetical protein
MAVLVRLRWPGVALGCLCVFLGCAYSPTPLDEVAFRQRAVTKSDADVRVTASVLSAEESRRVFGVALADDGIQAVWLQVENRDKGTFWFLSPGLDANYFSPLEAAYLNHSWLRGGRNRKIDDHFRALAFKNPVRPGKTVSGFVFVNLEEGTRVVDVDLVAHRKVKSLTFFIRVPGIRADYHDVDFDALHPPEAIVRINGEDALRAVLAKLPRCTTGRDGKKEGDPLNLVVIGHREDVFAAFIRRGWRAAEKMYGKAVWKTVKSFLFGSRYRYSPVSPLYVYGRRQDIAGQKPRRTVHQRNHLRLWLTPMRFEGKPVWIGQISRDIGVRFTLRAWPPVTHKIDPDVDEARSALVQDLLYSQGLARVGFVGGVGEAPPPEPRRNLTGDPYFTDGLRAVLILSRRPSSLSEIEVFDWERVQSRERETEEAGRAPR